MSIILDLAKDSMSKLHLAALANEEYAAAVQRVLTEEHSVELEAHRIAAGLVVEVLTGDVTVEDLRGAVAWANALDHEAVEGGICGKTDHEEAMARRIMHRAGRAALNHVKTEGRRVRSRVAYASACREASQRVLEENQTQIDVFRTESLVQYMLKERT